MKTRSLLLASLLAARASTADAVDVNGAIGAGYTRGDVATNFGTSATPNWDWLASLGVSGTPFNPDLLTFQGSGSYQARRDLYSGGASSSKGFGFHLSAGLLSASVIPTTLSASRGVSDFTSDLASQRTGSTLSTGYGGALLYQTEGRPTLTFGLSRTANVNSSFNQPDRNDGATSLRVGARQRLESLSYSLGYDTAWASGSFADTNYRTHNFRGEATAALSRDMDLRFNDQYNLRTPTVDASTNPRLESHAIGTGLGFGLGGQVTSRLDYGYNRALLQARGDPAAADRDQESQNHAVAYSATWRRSPALTLSGSVNGSLSDERLGAERVRSSAESLTAGATWTSGGEGGGLRLQLDGSGSLGVAQPRGAPSQGAYGVGAGVSVGTGLGGWTGSLGYHGAYGDGLSAGSGRSFSHGLTLTADGAPWTRGTLHALVTAQSNRRDDVLVGTLMDRSVSAQVRASWRNLTGELNAGLSDGLTAALRDAAFSDGLILSPGYDAHTRFAGVSLTWMVSPRLSLASALRGFEAASPGRPDVYEVGASLSAAYTIGAFTVQVQDQLSQGGAAGSFQRANLLMVRAMRSFGARFF